VAGTGSSKPYVFNADNVARYAPLPWHSGGSVIDCSYAALDAIARSTQAVAGAADGSASGGDEPEQPPMPPATRVSATIQASDAATVAGRDVWLVHPWALGEPPRDLPAGCLGLLLSDFHDAWPWNAARWSFVGERMAALAPLCWYASQQDVSRALVGARSVHTLDDPHVAHLLPLAVTRRAAPHLFSESERPCASFSPWCTRGTRGVASLHQLPGLAALARRDPAGPLFEQPEETERQPTARQA